jgi:hypothetical protein
MGGVNVFDPKPLLSNWIRVADVHIPTMQVGLLLQEVLPGVQRRQSEAREGAIT